MPTTIVIGGQWGDEGKGKIVDFLTNKLRPKWVVRFNGGENAGHTIVNSYGKFKLHLVPSGVFEPGTKCILGSGMVLNLESLLQEISSLDEVFGTFRVKISYLAHIVMPWHPLLEAQEEEDRGGNQISTTGKGIGPCYSDRVGRRGVQIRELTNLKEIRDKLSFLHRFNLKRLRPRFRENMPSVQEIIYKLGFLTEKLQSHFANTEDLLHEAQTRDEHIVLEGAQGTLLDVDYGLYPPYVTSSHTTRWGAYLGSGVKATTDDRVIGVFKAYVTRVGEGPFPTELDDETGEQLRERGVEYGTTTGRPRRVGWPDIPLARYSHKINGFTELAFTKTDILDALDKIRIAVAYRFKGKSLPVPPTALTDFIACHPSYAEMPGWCEDTTAARHFSELPEEMKVFLRTFEREVGIPIKIISVGPKREETILIE